MPKNVDKLSNQIVCGDALSICRELPKGFVDLLILDPPYNLTKKFGAETFREMTLADYEKWFDEWFVKLLPTLKHTATLYVCGEHGGEYSASFARRAMADLAFKDKPNN